MRSGPHYEIERLLSCLSVCRHQPPAAGKQLGILRLHLSLGRLLYEVALAQVWVWPASLRFG